LSIPELVGALWPAVSYGKGALVGGRDGEIEEHGGLGRPMRAAIGGGKAVIGSNVKVAAGASLELPLGHKDDPWSFPHLETITVSIAHAPWRDEIVVVMAIADGGRLRNRVRDGADPVGGKRRQPSWPASSGRPAAGRTDPWSFPHFDAITVSIADAPRPDEIFVVMAIADEGRLRNRCGTEPIIRYFAAALDAGMARRSGPRTGRLAATGDHPPSPSSVLVA
jgi:hypothetical protein